MTKEEIIQGLYRGDSKAIKEAIKVLEQDGTDMNVGTIDSDCVSRASVKELFQEGCVMGMYDFLGIDDLPPVTPTHCIAAVRFSKDDLREICNECIEIERTQGTCKECKKCDFEQSDQTYFCKPYGNFVCSSHYCKDFEKRGNENEIN